MLLLREESGVRRKLPSVKNLNQKAVLADKKEGVLYLASFGLPCSKSSRESSIGIKPS